MGIIRYIFGNDHSLLDSRRTMSVVKNYRNYTMRAGHNGHCWYVLLGTNINNGEIGFGKSLPDALENLAVVLNKQNIEFLLDQVGQLNLDSFPILD